MLFIPTVHLSPAIIYNSWGVQMQMSRVEVCGIHSNAQSHTGAFIFCMESF